MRTLNVIFLLAISSLLACSEDGDVGYGPDCKPTDVRLYESEAMKTYNCVDSLVLDLYEQDRQNKAIYEDFNCSSDRYKKEIRCAESELSFSKSQLESLSLSHEKQQKALKLTQARFSQYSYLKDRVFESNFLDELNKNVNALKEAKANLSVDIAKLESVKNTLDGQIAEIKKTIETTVSRLEDKGCDYKDLKFECSFAIPDTWSDAETDSFFTSVQRAYDLINEKQGEIAFLMRSNSRIVYPSYSIYNDNYMRGFAQTPFAERMREYKEIKNQGEYNRLKNKVKDLNDKVQTTISLDYPIYFASQSLVQSSKELKNLAKTLQLIESKLDKISERVVDEIELTELSGIQNFKAYSLDPALYSESYLASTDQSNRLLINIGSDLNFETILEEFVLRTSLPERLLQREKKLADFNAEVDRVIDTYTGKLLFAETVSPYGDELRRSTKEAILKYMSIDEAIDAYISLRSFFLIHLQKLEAESLYEPVIVYPIHSRGFGSVGKMVVKENQCLIPVWKGINRMKNIKLCFQ